MVQPSDRVRIYAQGGCGRPFQIGVSVPRVMCDHPRFQKLHKHDRKGYTFEDVAKYVRLTLMVNY